MPAHVRVGTLKTYIDGTRPQAICTASLEGRFLNVTVCIIKLRKLDSRCSGDATRGVHVG